MKSPCLAHPIRRNDRRCRVSVSGQPLFVSAVGGVQVFDPEGNKWGVIQTPDGRVPANCAFGGADARTLYITARQGLYEVDLAHPGLY